MKKRTWDDARALQLLGEGYTDIEIADMVGASVNSIKAWRYKNNLSANRRPKKADDQRTPDEPITKPDAPVEAPAVVETDLPVEAHANVDGDTEGKGHNLRTPPGPVEITFSFNGCTVSLSTPDLPSAARAASYLNTIVGTLRTMTDPALAL